MSEFEKSGPAPGMLRVVAVATIYTSAPVPKPDGALGSRRGEPVQRGQEIDLPELEALRLIDLGHARRPDDPLLAPETRTEGGRAGMAIARSG